MKKRVVALLLILTMMFLLCACGDGKEMVDLAKTALRASDGRWEVWKIYVMRYTNRRSLRDDEDSSGSNWIPRSGTAVIIEGKGGIDHVELFFFYENGSLAHHENVADLKAESEQAYRDCSLNPSWMGLEIYQQKADLYSYFWGMSVDAESEVVFSKDYGKDKGVPGSMQSDRWYALSEKQLARVLG